jgi:hypothetical protein
MEELILKDLAKASPWLVILFLGSRIVWREYLKPKLSNGMDTETSFNQLAMRVFDDLAKQIPLLKETLYNTTLLQAELASQFEEQRQDQKLQNSDLKIIGNKLDLLYKQVKENDENLTEKIDLLLGEKQNKAKNKKVS